MKGKGLGPILFVLLLLGGGYYVYTQVLGGSLTGPTKTPDLPSGDVDLPAPGEAVDRGAKGAEDGAKAGADFLAGLDPVVWRVVGVLGVVACVVWVIKNPKRLAIALGLGLLIAVVALMGQ